MAVVELSPLVTSIRGKIGQVVFQTSPYGQIAKINQPRGPRRPYISAVPVIDTGNVESWWGSRTVSEKNAWAAAAINFPTVDRYNNPRISSGHNFFQRVQMLYPPAIVATNLTPPALVNDGTLYVVSAVANFSDIRLNFERTIGAADGYLIVDMSPPLSTGILSSPRRFRRVVQENISGGPDFKDLLPAWREAYQSNVARSAVFIRVRIYARYSTQLFVETIIRIELPSTMPLLLIPSFDDWLAESASWSSANSAGAFASPLKLSLGGTRGEEAGSIFFDGTQANYWASTASGIFSQLLFFNTTLAFMDLYYRARGMSVRLILQGTFTQQHFDDLYSGETIVIAGLTYGYAYNPATSKIWLDRNLGATQVATSSTDTAAYGWLYQWGRLTDGHQIRTSPTTAVLSSGDVPGNNSFIITSSDPTFDWRDPQNNNLWQGVNGINLPI